jgi:hypothetical protein
MQIGHVLLSPQDWLATPREGAARHDGFMGLSH